MADSGANFYHTKDRNNKIPISLTLANKGKYLRIYNINYEDIENVYYTFRFNLL